MQIKNMFLGLTIVCCLAVSCQPDKPLPILGKMEENFRFVNQDSQWVTPQTTEGQVYVTDFFFTSCPTICPVMKSQMIRVHEKFKDAEGFVLLSHSIDPNDSVAVLRDYAQRLGISSEDWHMVTGKREDIFDVAKKYMNSADVIGIDKNAPGGFIHSGAFILIDQQRRIRGYYDGTKAAEVDDLMVDIEKLLKSENTKDE